MHRVGRLSILRRAVTALCARIAARDPHPVRGVFLRALGGVYLIAFASLGAQVKGLYGRRGIRPITEYLDALRELPTRERLTRAPTIFWIDASDETLVRACRAGQLGSVVLALGIAPRATTFALWSLYLSFVSVGREFLSYQWDALLLETGLLAVIVAPGRRRELPPWIATAALRWLAFRLHFESGHCKLASGDQTWRSGEACCVHFETQPLPTPWGWHVHQLPPRVKRGATYAALAFELAVPWLAFAPRKARRAAFGLLALLQATIAATGNYGFFNLLALVDNIWLLDDVLPRRTQPRGVRPRWWRRLGTALVALPLVAVSVSMFAARLSKRAKPPRALVRLHDALAPFYAVSPYGLFAVMTTSRPEIVIEGSNDGVHWREYEFRYKAGDLQQPPHWVAPHQPRLDWQMWFAAMQPAPRWFGRLMQRLLEGSPEVLALFARDPFDGRAPKYVRALLYDYRMSDRETRKRTGAWWQRELYGTYVPTLELPRRDERDERASSDGAARA